MSGLRTRGGRLALIVGASLLLLVGVAAAGIFGGRGHPPANSARPSARVSATRHGEIATVIARTFARSAHPRTANSWGEIRARAYVSGVLQQFGYTPRPQEFIAATGGGRIHSANIIAVKQGNSAQELIVGAHYDSAALGQGYLDNATGIGLLLELAGRIRPVATPCTIVFVAFGAEEDGALGSRYYVKSMPALQRTAVVGMIDLDAVAGGDQICVTSRLGGPTWLRDDALTAAKQLGVPLRSSPAGPGRPAGVAVAPSDDEAFATADIATASFTSLNWTLSGRGGPVVTAEDGPIWHTPKDSVAYIERKYPGRVRRQMAGLSRVLEALLTSKLETHT